MPRPLVIVNAVSRMHRGGFPACLVLMASYLIAACASPPRFDVARVAVLAPLTGQDATMGQEIAAGVQLAVEDWNAAGGVHGLHLELVTTDDASSGPRRVSDDRRVVLAISHTALPSPAARGTAVPAIPPPVILLGIGGAAQPGAGVVRLAPSAEQVAEVAAAAVAFNYGPVTLAVVSSAAPEDVAEAAAFIRAARARGIRVRAEYTLADVEASYAQAAGAVRAAAPQVLYVVGRGVDAGSLWAEIRPRDSRIRLVLGPGVLDEGFSRTAAGFLDGVSALDIAARPTDVQGAREFIARFTARYGRAPGPLAARAYDAATLGLRAIASATDGRAPSREAVRATLSAETALDGVLRPYTLANGAPSSWKLALYRLMPDGTPLLIGEPELR